MGRAFAAVHHEQALGLEAAAAHQVLHASLQRFVCERFELVEDRRDHGRVEHQHEQVERHPGGPGPQPPQRPGGAHDPQHQRRDRQPDHGADERALDHVGQVELERHAVEAEPLLDAEGAVQLERQVEQRPDHDEGGQQRKLVAQVAQARLHGLAQCRVERAEAAEQRPADQHGGAEGHRQQAETALGKRVVGGFLVRGERDVRREGRGHGVAVRGHVAHLARREPELHEQGGDERRSEQERQGQRWHGCEV